MKRYTIGLITGILLTASAFMFMGAQSIKNNGKVQAVSHKNNLYLLDTEGANVYRLMSDDFWLNITGESPFHRD